MKQLRYLILIIFLTGVFASAFAQYENTSGNKEPKKQEKKQPLQKRDRWFVGGMFGAGFSSYSSYVEVSPLVGFKVTPSFHVGTRFNYIWNSYEFPNGVRESLHHFGVGAFGRYIIYKGLFAQVEYEALNFDYYDYRGWINSLFIGGGYYQSFGRSFASFAILFNVLDNINSPYVNPVIRIGFGVGF